MLAADGAPIAIRGGGGQVVPLSAISPWLVDAVVATEDRRFFHHFGVDPVGLGRAALDNLRAGAVVAGGSTITQQLAKNLYLTPERSLARKLQELTLALWLEVRLSKKEILTLYLNRAYLGAGAYGAEAASRRYFGKSAADLSLPEAAMLAGLLKAPSALAPTSDLARARERATIVLGRMEAEGYITPAQARAARAKPAKLAPETRVGRRLVRRLGARRPDRPSRQAGARSGRAHDARPAGAARRRAGGRADAGGGLRQEPCRRGRRRHARHNGCGAGDGGRPRPCGRPVQPGGGGAPPARLRLQAVRLRHRARGRLAAGQHDRRPPGPARRLAAGELRRPLSRPDHPHRGVRGLGQHGRRPSRPDRRAGARRGQGARDGRGLGHAARPLDRARHLRGQPARADRSLSALRDRRHSPAALRRDQCRGRPGQGALPSSADGGAGRAARGGRGHAAAVGRGRDRWHWPRRAPARPHGRRQDRDQPGRPRRLVRRLCRQLGRRRLARQRRQPSDERRARRWPAGPDLARGNAGDAQAAPARRPPRRRSRSHRTAWNG